MFGKKTQVGNDIYGVNSKSKLDNIMGDSGETGFRHSDYFHKYFHGYTEIRIPKENGKFRIERYYTDDWYFQDVSDKRWIGQKVLILFLTAASMLAYFRLMSLPGLSGNCSKIVAIPGFIAVIFQILLAASAIGYAAAKRKMTWWEQHSSNERLERYSLITGFLLLFTAFLILANLFTGTANPAGEVLLALGVAISGGLTLAICAVEKHTAYRTKKNDIKLPEGEAHLIL